MTSVGAVNGNTAGLSADRGGYIHQTLDAGDTLWVRGTFPSVNTTQGSDTLAIDNFVACVSAVPEPANWAPVLTDLTGAGLFTRRRKA